MTDKQKLVLFLISCERGFSGVYALVKLFDRADFPSEIDKAIGVLLDNDFIRPSKWFDNNTASEYSLTDEGRAYMIQLKSDEILAYVLKLPDPGVLLEITKTLLSDRLK